MIYAIGIILYILIFVFRNKMNFIIYQILISFVYLITLSFIQTLDVTLALYLLFSILPFINSFKLPSTFSLITLLFLVFSLLTSVLFNGFTSAISIFIIRLIGILFFVYIFSNVEINVLDLKQIKITSLCVLILETIIGIIGYIMSPNLDRLMLNYQCTVGCLSISGILLVFLHVYLKKRFDIFSILIAIAFCVWAILSGTRGYIVITLGFSAFLFLFYGNKFIKILLFPTLLILIALNFTAVWDVFSNLTRINESTGIRHAENELLYMLFNQNSIFYKLVGYGYGRKIGTIDNIDWIIRTVSYNDFVLSAFPSKDGFHNFYGTILYSSGIIGLFFVGSLFFYIFLKIKNNISSRKEIAMLSIYVGIYMFILWFRWTATSGILEFATIAFCISFIKKNESLNSSIGCEYNCG